MKTASAKAKGRKLQVVTAETLARTFGLTIEANPPTKPGQRNGVNWVPEGDSGDLRVRRMGEAGSDVVLASARARGLVRLPLVHAVGPVEWLPPFIECRNQEALRLGAETWRDGSLAVVHEALTRRAEGPVLAVISRNRWPALAAFECGAPGIIWWVRRVPGPYLILPSRVYLRVPPTQNVEFNRVFLLPLDHWAKAVATANGKEQP